MMDRRKIIKAISKRLSGYSDLVSVDELLQISHTIDHGQYGMIRVDSHIPCLTDASLHSAHWWTSYGDVHYGL